jgi:hypothetical protein
VKDMSQLTKQQLYILLDGIAQHYKFDKNIDLTANNFVFLLEINNLQNVSNNYQAIEQKVSEELRTGEYEQYDINEHFKKLINVIDTAIYKSLTIEQPIVVY